MNNYYSRSGRYLNSGVSSSSKNENVACSYYSFPPIKEEIHKGWGHDTIIFNPGGNNKPTIWFWDMFGDGSIIFQFYKPHSWRVRFFTKILFGSVWTKNNE